MMDFANFVDSIWGTDKAQLGVPREREREGERGGSLEVIEVKICLTIYSSRVTGD